MTKEQEALKQALGYVKRNCPALVFNEIKEALAQPAQEPVAWMCYGEPYAVKQMRLSINGGGEHPNQVPLYTTPQQRSWVGLTQDEVLTIGRQLGLKCKLGGNANIDFDYADSIEAKLKEKNT
jgi:hypothetical protein